MINSYGLYWREDRVFWGRQKVPGTLMGAASRGKRARAVNFREQRGIYALYADHELVYIGQTGAGDQRLFKRLKDHRTDHLSERWNRFSWFGTQRVLQDNTLSMDTVTLQGQVSSMLNILEAVATAIAEPRLNLQRGKWSDTPKYYQYLEHQEDEDDED